MKSLRSIGLKHIYLDENIEEFSNVATGLILRGIGANFNILYFNNFFSKKFQDFFLEFNVTFVSDISELSKLDLSSFDLILFDNIDSKFNFKEILNIENLIAKSTEIIYVFSDKNIFNKNKDRFDLITEFNYVVNRSELKLNSDLKIFNITGNGKGKSTFLFGELIRMLLNKKDVELVYFDKGGDFYTEKFFFEMLKDKLKTDFGNNLGSFDFYVSGMQRFDGKKFRFENIEEDFSEAKRGLEIISEIDKNKTRVIFADELNSAVGLKLIEINFAVERLSNLKNSIYLSGRYSTKEIIGISDVIVEVKEIKHYVNFGYSVKRGVDF